MAPLIDRRRAGGKAGEREQAYEQAGADVLYAPGLRTAEEIRLICEATNKPRPMHGTGCSA